MNLPVEFVPLQQLLWGRMQDLAQNEQTFLSFRTTLTDYVAGLGLPLLIAAFIFFVAFRLYQPRVPRGGFWTPAFGLFGHAPKLYLHTRPPSFAGAFARSRHRVFTSRRRASSGHRH